MISAPDDANRAASHAPSAGAATARARRPFATRVAACLLGMLVLGGLASPGTAQDLDLKPLAGGETRAIKIAVGGIADPTHIAVWLPKYDGTFAALEKNGITVEVVPFGGGSEWLLAMTSGQVELSLGYFENGIRARSQGRDVIGIYDILPTPAFAVVVRKGLADTVKSVKDAKGLSWGFTSFGSASHVVSLRVASFFGLEQSAVKWIPVGGTSGWLPAIRESRVDLETASVMAADQLVLEDSAKMLVDLNDPKIVSEIYGSYLGPALMTSKAFVEKNPYVTYKIVEAVHNAIHRVRTEPADSIAKLLPAEFQVPALTPAIASLAKSMSVDGITDPKAVAAMVKDMRDLKLGRGMEPTDMIDNRFAQKVAAAAGPGK